MLSVLFAWNVDMRPRDAGVILGDEKESRMTRTVEQNGRRGLGLWCPREAANQISPANLSVTRHLRITSPSL